MGNVVIVVGYMRYEQTFWDNKQVRKHAFSWLLMLLCVQLNSCSGLKKMDLFLCKGNTLKVLLILTAWILAI